MTGRTHRPSPAFAFPGQKRFAFTIFDDTDVATVDSIRPLYELFTRLGLRTTKTVWPLRFAGRSSFAGSHTLQDADYARYMRELADRGFEIAYHGPTMESSLRADAVRALELFRETFGSYPRSFASHSMNRDNLYWGEDRFHSKIVRAIYKLMSREGPDRFQGHVEGSPYFWGDLSRRHLEFVRGFTFNGIDVWDVTPHACYQDPSTPWVNAWFSSCDADNVEEFVELLSEENQDRLEARGGLCIVSTHLGKGFVQDGRVDARVERLLTRLASRRGWFAPVSDIMSYLKASGEVRRISPAARRGLEWRWLLHSLLRRSRQRDYVKHELAYLAASAPVPPGDSPA